MESRIHGVICSSFYLRQTNLNYSNTFLQKGNSQGLSVLHSYGFISDICKYTEPKTATGACCTFLQMWEGHNAVKFSGVEVFPKRQNSTSFIANSTSCCGDFTFIS